MSILDNITILECSHDLVAANVSLRLSQLGARVIRITNNEGEDQLKRHAYYGQFVGEESLLYHSKSRGKEHVELDKEPQIATATLMELLAQADVVIYNYNSNIFAELGIEPEDIREKHPQIVMAEYSDYGSHTIYKDRVGDDLLVQAMSGITLLTADRDDAPTPMGFKAATQFCATYLTQATLAALYRRESGASAATKVSTSLLEAIIQVQMEVITTSANDSMKMPRRAKRGNAHAGLPAPYGVYRSKDGYFAMSMISIPVLCEIMGLECPEQWQQRESWLWYRDQIMEFLAPHFLTKSNREWMELFTPLDVWCSDIFTLKETLELEAYKILEIEQSFLLPEGRQFVSTKRPYSIELNPCPNMEQERTHGDGDLVLDGVMVVDISQYLSGPTSTLQLGDFGATVVKIERPEGGDSGRNVIISNLLLDQTSSSFLTVGRNKRSAALDLKDSEQRAQVKELLRQADVVVQNFRPSVMKRLGLDYEAIKEINPRVIYAEISGYGDKGCWVRKPGQDYIVQALSGLCYLSGQRSQAPIPMGLSVVDLISGAHVDEAITAALYNRARRGDGAHIKISMLESAMDLQSDFITAHRWSAEDGVWRSRVASAHPAEDAPYGIYATKDGYIAIGSAPIEALVEQMPKIDEGCDWSTKQDIIKGEVTSSIAKQSTAYWVAKLEKYENARCGEIYDWQGLFGSELGESLGMLQRVRRKNGFEYLTTRCPVRFNDTIIRHPMGAPRVGEYTDEIVEKYNLKQLK